MESEPMFFCLLLGCLISLLIIPLMLLPSLKRSVMVCRNRREDDTLSTTGQSKVPRCGGVALAASFLAVSLMICFAYPTAWTSEAHVGLVMLWTGLAVFFIGLWDDFRPLNIRWKILIQTLVCLAVYLQGVQIESVKAPLIAASCPLGPWSGVVTVLWLVTLINLFGRIDSINGLAGGMGLVLMGLLAFLGVGAGMGFQALCAIGMAGALLGFLVYNLPPTRICMGNSGAGLVGFLIGNLSIMHHGTEASSAGMAMVALPLMGVVLTLGFGSRTPQPVLASDAIPTHRRMTNLPLPRVRGRS